MGTLVKIGDGGMGVFSLKDRERLLREKELAWLKLIEKNQPKPPFKGPKPDGPKWVKHWYWKRNGARSEWTFMWVWR
jgi:hypothetical protein